MTTYTTRPQDAAHIEADPGLHGEQPQRTSPMLFAALALALLALGIWWYMQRDSGAAVTAPVTTTIIEPIVTPAAPDAKPAARINSTRGERAPVIAERAPRPLAANPLPEYPRAALRNGEEGSVLLSIAIDARGVPSDVQVVERSGTRDRSFDRAAIEAARQWRFEPAMRNGKAVPATVQLPVDFRRG